MHARRALALAVSVPLLLVSCSSDPEPTPKMPDPPASSSPTPTLPQTPEAESPEDFIRRWVKAGDEMQVTGRVEAFRRLSKGCTACAALIKNVQEVYQGGGSIEFDGTTISRLNEMSDDPPTYQLDLDTPATRVLDSAGKGQRVLPPGVGKYVITLRRVGDAWRVTHYGRR